MKNFKEKVWDFTKKIPRGRVVSYHDIARAVGEPRAYRAVGNALNKNIYKNIPCHRVVRSDGGIGGYNKGTNKKAELLRREGVAIKRGIVNLDKCRWKKIYFR